MTQRAKFRCTTVCGASPPRFRTVTTSLDDLAAYKLNDSFCRNESLSTVAATPRVATVAHSTTHVPKTRLTLDFLGDRQTTDYKPNLAYKPNSAYTQDVAFQKEEASTVYNKSIKKPTTPTSYVITSPHGFSYPRPTPDAVHRVRITRKSIKNARTLGQTPSAAAMSPRSTPIILQRPPRTVRELLSGTFSEETPGSSASPLMYSPSSYRSSVPRLPLSPSPASKELQTFGRFTEPSAPMERESPIQIPIHNNTATSQYYPTGFANTILLTTPRATLSSPRGTPVADSETSPLSWRHAKRHIPTRPLYPAPEKRPPISVLRATKDHPIPRNKGFTVFQRRFVIWPKEDRSSPPPIYQQRIIKSKPRRSDTLGLYTYEGTKDITGSIRVRKFLPGYKAPHEQLLAGSPKPEGSSPPSRKSTPRGSVSDVQREEGDYYRNATLNTVDLITEPEFITVKSLDHNITKTWRAYDGSTIDDDGQRVPPMSNIGVLTRHRVGSPRASEPGRVQANSQSASTSSSRKSMPFKLSSMNEQPPPVVEDISLSVRLKKRHEDSVTPGGVELPSFEPVNGTSFQRILHKFESGSRARNNYNGIRPLDEPTFMINKTLEAKIRARPSVMTLGSEFERIADKTDTTDPEDISAVLGDSVKQPINEKRKVHVEPLVTSPFKSLARDKRLLDPREFMTEEEKRRADEEEAAEKKRLKAKLFVKTPLSDVNSLPPRID